MIKYFHTIASVLLFFIVLMTSCSAANENEAPSASIIPQDKFTEILAECQLAESQMTVTRVLQPLYKDSILNYYQGIFDTYQVTTESFNESLKFYTKDPANMDSIYSGVLQILQKKSDDLGEIEIPTNNLSAISRTQLGNILNQTPFSDSILADDSYKIQKFRTPLMVYLDSNQYLLDSAKVNSASFEFSFVINTSTKIMTNQLKDYLLSIKNKSTK